MAFDTIRDEKIATLIRGGLNYKAVGDIFGLSRERVRQIANRIGIAGCKARNGTKARRLALSHRKPDRGPASKTNLSLHRLRELLVYFPDTGMWKWINPRGRAASGEFAGTAHPSGYKQIRIDGELYMAHVLAWLYVHERWPESMIDHQNQDKSDNRLVNLRQATRSQNFGNTKKTKINTSGRKGVYFDKRTNKWRAEIAHVKLGRFATKEDAAQAYADAAKIRFGEFART